MTHMSPGAVGYPLLAAAGALALAVDSKDNYKKSIGWMALANVLNSYAIYKAFNAPYFAVGLAIGTIFVSYISPPGPGGKYGPFELAAALHVGGFFLASAKILDLLTTAP